MSSKSECPRCRIGNLEIYDFPWYKCSHCQELIHMQDALVDEDYDYDPDEDFFGDYDDEYLERDTFDDEECYDEDEDEDY